jgi:hypothetical protein
MTYHRRFRLFFRLNILKFVAKMGLSRIKNGTHTKTLLSVWINRGNYQIKISLEEDFTI